MAVEIDLSGRVALVTGAASGIGRGCALHLAREGAAVAVLDRDLAGARETVGQVEDEGGAALPLQVDVSQATQVRSAIAGESPVLVTLDSNHTRQHVVRELELYSELVGPGGYIVVFDGVMQVLTDAPGGQPTWDTDNPWHAVQGFIEENDEFQIDPYYNRLKVTHSPGGFLKRVKKRRP